jgi:Ca2+-binding EF-hand superfamily protein
MIKRVFGSMDNSGDGFLESDELLAFARYYENDPTYSEERCARLIKMMNGDSDGKVAEANFVAFFMQLTQHIADESIFDEGIARYLEVGARVSRDRAAFGAWKRNARHSSEQRGSLLGASPLASRFEENVVESPVSPQYRDSMDRPSDLSTTAVLNPERLIRIREVFMEMDDDTSGFISVSRTF